jgi:DNA repair protein SbcC/Rad50
MISELSIKNFQSHVETNLKFHPGVNVIIGPSDSGKTSILRAIDWVVKNTLGDGVRRTETKETSVVLDKVTRKKTDSSNQYEMDEIVFKATKAETPEEVLKELNLGPINFQRQLDSPFLLSSSPGEVARFFNKMANIDKIDKGLSYCKKKISTLSSNETFLHNEVMKGKDKIEKFSFLDEMEKDVLALEKMESEFEMMEDHLEQLLTLLEKMDEARDELKEAESVPVLKIQADIDMIKTLDAKLYELESERSAIQSKLNEFNRLEKQMFEEEKSLEILEKEFKRIKPKECPLCGQEWKK